MGALGFEPRIIRLLTLDITMITLVLQEGFEPSTRANLALTVYKTAVLPLNYWSIKMLCIICNKELKGRQTKYCSNKCKCKVTNNKYQNYACQQRRGISRKLKLINLLGGECSNCGYSKSIAALHFHHLKEKEFKLSQRELSNRKWDSILKEVSKCKLLCANCHAEHHYNKLV